MTTALAARFDKVSKRYKLGSRSLRSALGRVFSRSRDGNGKELWALKDVSFEIHLGEAVGLVGPNGAGKSTTLRLLAGITRPTIGYVHAIGRVSSLLELGAGFHPELTGRENVFLYGSILGLRRRETQRSFDRIVSFSELEPFLDTPVKRYSSGMYVRLAFAVAAHVHPDLLLVDEVLAVGDAGFRRKCMDRIAELRRNGTTLVFVSHSPHMVQTVCDRAIYLAEGKIRLDGDVDEVLSTYEHDLRRSRMSAIPAGAQEETVPGAALGILDIAVVDLEGHRRESFDYSEGAEIKIAYRASSPISSPILHVRLFRDDGTPCFTVRSNQRNAMLGGVTLAGEGEFALRLASLQLYGGLYRAQVAIIDHSNRVILARGYSPWFQVDGPGNISLENERLGVYVPDAQWEVQRGPVL